MKKIIITLFIFALTSTIVQGHTISRKNARQFLENVLGYLKTSDSASFIKLWSLEDSNAPKYYGKTFTQKDILSNYYYLKEFLDTALAQNLKMESIDKDKEVLEGTDTEYWIQCWFKYRKNYYKGFGFYIAYKNNQWVVRSNPSTSTLRRG